MSIGKKLIVITVIDGLVRYVDEWDSDEYAKVKPMEVYFGKKLLPGVDYGVFYHDTPKDKSPE